MGVYKNNNGNLELISGATLWADAPIGAIQAFGGSVAPSGWFLCQGQALSRTDYAELFAVIGTSFGSGDGSTTFNLPDLRDKFPEGASGTNALGDSKGAGLPNITGALNTELQGRSYYGTRNPSGALDSRNTVNVDVPQNSGTQSAGQGLSFDASKSNSIYGNSDTVQPPAIFVNYIIKAQQTALPADFMDALDDKQDATDNNLETTAKTVVGAINEINNSLTEFHTVSGITTSGGGNLATNYNYGEYVLIPICAYGTNEGSRVSSLYPITRVMNDNKLGFHILSDDLNPVAKVNYAVTVEFLLIKI